MSIQTKNFVCNPKKNITMVFRGSVNIVVTTGSGPQQKAEFSMPLAAPKYYRFHSGLLSANEKTMVFHDRDSGISYVLAAQDSSYCAAFTFYQDSNEVTETVEDIQRVDIFSNKILVTYNQTDGHNNTASNPDQTPSAIAIENAQLKAKLNASMEHLNNLKESVQKLLKENKELKTKNTALERAVDMTLNDLIASQRTGADSLSENFREKLQELDNLRNANRANEQSIRAAKAEIEQLNANTDAQAQELESLQDQLTSLRAQEEVMSLDCSKASAELEDLKVRLQMDGDIVNLTESRWLKNNSVSATLEEMKHKIDAMEDRIGFMLNARAIYNRTVQAAVLLSGDGSISTTDENGTVQQPDTDTEQQP